jgi:hypothetical protein
VDDDRTIAPSPGRLRRAWQAGLRPGSRWLVLGLTLVGVTAWVGRSTGELDPRPVAVQLELTLVDPSRASAVLMDLVHAALAVAGVVVAMVLGVVLLVATLTGGLGPIDAAQRRGLALGRVRVSGLPLVAIAAAALLISGGQLAAVVAGASRAVDASEGGLVAAWQGWAMHTAWMLALVLVGCGLVELGLARRRLRLALHQSVAGAREDMRRRGGQRA